MKDRLIILAAVVVSCWSVATAQNNDETAVRDVLTQNSTAFEKADIATMDRIWANDEGVIVIENGHANYGWLDYRNNHLAPEMKEFKNTKYTLSDIKVTVDGRTAWATFKYAIAGELGNRKIEGGGLGTAIFSKRDDRWMIVHWHSSAPRRPPNPAPAPKQNE